jgi:mannose-6-phosphate isomerase-like protein (cupin superfamily)
MKLKLIAVVCAFPLIAADPAGFAHWSSSDLKGITEKLVAKGGKFASQTLEKFGNHYTMLAHREANGEAELHETEADLFVVESGNATLIVGGKIKGGKTSAPNEVRGPSIEGGVKKALGPGDIVHIPAKTPHQLMLEGSKEFTYFVMKVGGQ